MSAGVDQDRLRSLFEAACDLDPAELPGFIAEHCAGDRSLQDELESLLAFDGEGDDALSDDAIDSATRLGEPDREIEIPGFRIIRRLGEGGMGVVYEAEQDSPSRRVALKLMRHGISTREERQRFRRESEIQASLGHPGIARIFETGVTDHLGLQTPYIAMELVDGVPLTSFACSTELDADARVRLMIAVCEAVESAHDIGVVHRDLKPENILVESPDEPRVSEAPRIKVLDFGVARLAGPGRPLATLQTRTGQIIGTLAYMSPEQVLGSSDIDARADVHALGVILYELLTGERPFDLTGRTLPDSARIIQEDEPTSIASRNRCFRGDLNTIVAKAIEKDPARRYPSAGALASDLALHLASQPISARPAGRVYRLKKFTRRNKALVMGTVATILALTVGLVVSIVFAVHATAEGERARWASYRSSITAASGALASHRPRGARDILDRAPSEFRGWEWDHLACRLIGWSAVSPRALVEVASDSITGRVYGLTPGGELVEWDTDSATLTPAWAGGPRLRRISPQLFDGVGAALTIDRRLVRFRLEDGATSTLGGSEDDPRSLGIDRQGHRLMACFQDRVEVWDVRSGDRALSINPFERGGIRAAAISPDGIWIACTSSGTTQNRAAIVRIEDASVRSVRSSEQPYIPAFSPNGSLVAFSMRVRNVHVYSTESWEKASELRGLAGSVSGLVFLSDTAVAAVSNVADAIRVWDPRSGANLKSIPVLLGDEKHTTQLAAAPRSGREPRLVLKREGDQPAFVFDPERTAADVLDHGDGRYIYELDWSPDGRHLVSAPFRTEGAPVWDVDRRRVEFMIPGKNTSSGALGFSTGGDRLLISRRSWVGEPTRLELWDTERWARIEDDLGEESVPDDLGGVLGKRPTERRVVSPDRRTVVFLSKPVSDLPASIERDGSAEPVPEPLLSIKEGVWDPHERWFVGVSRKPAEDGTRSVLVLNRELDTVLAVLPHPASVHSICVHPDGSRLATGGDDGVIRLWDTRRWDKVLELNGHDSYIYSLEFSPDGSRLASGSGDGTVRIWDTVPKPGRAPRHTTPGGEWDGGQHRGP